MCLILYLATRDAERPRDSPELVVEEAAPDASVRRPPKGAIEVGLDTLDPRRFFFNERFLYRITRTAGSRLDG